ncbi:MAG: cyanophycinase [Bacteroidetes bacterium]|nr:cyanophycinase [Bacteroidota bacterium]
MNKFPPQIIALLVLLSFNSYSQSLYTGSLVIVGGGLEPTNKNIYNELIELAGGTEKASFAVIPSASGVAMQSYMSFRNILISYRIKPENIHLINIAMIDDDSTKAVNESEWKNNGNDSSLARIVRSCSAVWFTGGDQSRTMKTLLMPDGRKTAVLEAVWDVFRLGGAVGGTSAGAAIMSEAMIGGGNSLAALTHGVITDYSGDDFSESAGVMMSKGLGFFPYGIVDQHFNQRVRIGRLIVALMYEKNRFNLGFGVDENTALIYLGKQNLVKVAGASSVTIIKTADARISYIQKLPEIKNLLVSSLDNGDTFDPITGIITPAGDKKPTRGNEYYNVKNPGQAGIFSSNSASFHDLITINLIDNKGADTVHNLSFFDESTGFQVTLFKMPLSAGFYCDRQNEGDRYTVTNIRMDISPVHISITPFIKKEY